MDRNVFPQFYLGLHIALAFSLLKWCTLLHWKSIDFSANATLMSANVVFFRVMLIKSHKLTGIARIKEKLNRMERCAEQKTNIVEQRRRTAYCWKQQRKCQQIGNDKNRALCKMSWIENSVQIFRKLSLLDHFGSFIRYSGIEFQLYSIDSMQKESPQNVTYSHIFTAYHEWTIRCFCHSTVRGESTHTQPLYLLANIVSANNCVVVSIDKSRSNTLHV